MTRLEMPVRKYGSLEQLAEGTPEWTGTLREFWLDNVSHDLTAIGALAVQLEAGGTIAFGAGADAPDFWLVRGDTDAPKDALREEGGGDDGGIATQMLLKSAHDTIEAFMTAIGQLRSQRDDLVAALNRIASAEPRADRRHAGMVDVSEVQALQRIARIALVGAKAEPS